MEHKQRQWNLHDGPSSMFLVLLDMQPDRSIIPLALRSIGLNKHAREKPNNEIVTFDNMASRQFFNIQTTGELSPAGPIPSPVVTSKIRKIPQLFGPTG